MCLTLGDICLSFTSFSLLKSAPSSIFSSMDSTFSGRMEASLVSVPRGLLEAPVTALGLLWWMVLKVMEAERQYSSKPYKYLGKGEGPL